MCELEFCTSSAYWTEHHKYFHLSGHEYCPLNATQNEHRQLRCPRDQLRVLGGGERTFVFSRIRWGFSLFGMTETPCCTWYLSSTCRNISFVPFRSQRNVRRHLVNNRLLTCAGLRLCFLPISATTGSSRSLWGSLSSFILQYKEWEDNRHEDRRLSGCKMTILFFLRASL